jgi:hypothetical protein
VLPPGLVAAEDSHAVVWRCRYMCVDHALRDVERSHLVNVLPNTLGSVCVLVVAVLGFAGCGSDGTGGRRTPSPSAEEASFSYRGSTGPERWGELDPKWRTCGEGSEQSPIDLAEAKGRQAAVTRAGVQALRRDTVQQRSLRRAGS